MAKENTFKGINSGRTFKRRRELGKGDWGTVYKVNERGKPYACKVPHRETEEPKLLLKKEAQIQNEVNHPYVSPVVLFDQSIQGNNDSPFLVTPLAKTDLAKYLKKHGPPSAEAAYSLCEGLADALNTFHKNGIVVSDIQPANILLYKDPKDARLTGKLSDFGGAAHINRNDEYLLATGDYEAPEFHTQARPQPTLDQYGWAAGIVHPVFTGRLGRPQPFERDIAKKMTPLYEAIEDIAARAMATNPNQRYPSMADLLDDLRVQRIKVQEKGKNKKIL